MISAFSLFLLCRNTRMCLCVSSLQLSNMMTYMFVLLVASFLLNWLSMLCKWLGVKCKWWSLMMESLCYIKSMWSSVDIDIISLFLHHVAYWKSYIKKVMLGVVYGSSEGLCQTKFLMVVAERFEKILTRFGVSRHLLNMEMNISNFVGEIVDSGRDILTKSFLLF